MGRGQYDDLQRRHVHLENVVMTNLPRFATLEARMAETDRRLAALEMQLEAETTERAESLGSAFLAHIKRRAEAKASVSQKALASASSAASACSASCSAHSAAHQHVTQLTHHMFPAWSEYRR